MSIFADVWRVLYDDDEQQALRNEEQMGDLNTRIESLVPTAISPPAPLDDVPESYVGPKMTEGEPIDDNFITQLIDLYSAQSKDKEANVELDLPEAYVKRIVRNVITILENEKAFHEINIPRTGALTVVGDTHGQLLDVLTIFQMRGRPSSTNIFVFNGDFVDRGPQGVEVLLLLYSMKLVDPSSIYLNRGNHEHRRMNARYGFEDQVLDRYDQETYELIQHSFENLPLGAIVDDQILIVHGGLFPHENVTLKDLKRIPHRIQLPRHSKIEGRDQELMEGLLWSDPRAIQGTKPSTRGCGFHFGSDVSRAFLDQNNLSLLIRSHECEQDGYEVVHDERVVTIFSASYYSKKHQNQGAVVVFEGKDADQRPLKPSYHQFYASAYAMTSKEVEAKLQKESLQALREKIFFARDELLVEFEKYKEEDIPEISLPDWATALQNVLKLDISFLALHPYLVKPDEETEYEFAVNIYEFLSQFRLQTSKEFKTWMKQTKEDVNSNLSRHFDDIQAAFTSADTNGDGHLSYQEVITALASLKKLHLSPSQLLDICLEVDKNSDGIIDFDEFTSTFKVTRSVSNPRIKAHLKEIARLIHTKHAKHQIRHAFRLSDENDDQSLDRDEFCSLLTSTLGLDCSAEQINDLWEIFDSDHSGTISYREFRAILRPLEKKTVRPLNDFMKALTASKVQVKSAFRKLDTDNSGSLDKQEFLLGMKVFNEMLPENSQLEDKQLETLFHCFDTNNDGEVDLDEFMSAFRVGEAQK